MPNLPGGVSSKRTLTLRSLTYSLPKKMQVSSPGRATPARNGLKRGRGKVSTPITLPPHSQNKKLTGFTDFAAPRSPFFAFLIPFCSIIHLQQVSTSFLGSLAFH